MEVGGLGSARRSSRGTELLGVGVAARWLDAAVLCFFRATVCALCSQEEG